MTLRARIAGCPDLFELHVRAPQRYPFLLQSVAGHPQSGRYDLLFAAPAGALVLARGALRRDGRAESGDFFQALSAWAESEHSDAAPDEPLPFLGGWFLTLGYEAGAQVEPRVAYPPSPYRWPDALAVRCRAAVIVDQLERCTWVVAETPALLADLQAEVADAAAGTVTASEGPLLADLQEEEAEHFLEGVRRILEYLKAGDVFQVNLSRRWQGRLAPGVGYADIYRRLRRSNPAPFAGLATWEGGAVLSSSPERLVQVQDGWAQTRPIAGTRPRGATAEEDAALRQRLLDSLKERAEHIMLIDLERNDLGRVCAPGSVTVSELMTIESYAHVHHIVSNVRGKLRSGTGLGQVLRAVFPGGTITGCPKVRAMEIIAELEGEGRGPYTGAMGYISRDGRMDTNILIRSLVCEDGRVSLRAGAGIVADSDPALELAETRAKARGLLLALGGT